LTETSSPTLPKNVGPSLALGIGQIISSHFCEVASKGTPSTLHLIFLSFLNPKPDILISPVPSLGPDLG